MDSARLHEEGALNIRVRHSISDERAAVYKRVLGKGTSVTFANPAGSIWFEAIIDGKVVGVCCLVNKSGRCKSDVVAPSFRGRGIYASLFKARMDEAKAMGLTKLTTFSNANSRPMYLKYGFKKMSERNGTAYMVWEAK